MTRPDFDVAMKKGALGETVVRRILEANGWVVYQPMSSGPHQFDMMCIKNKRSAVAFDIKAKARMNKFPCTGVNQKHFDEYKRFSERHLMPFWIVFVDEGMRSIYGNTIDELEKPRIEGGISYPWTPKWKAALRLWPLSAMRTIADISEKEAVELNGLSQRSYEYKVKA